MTGKGDGGERGAVRPGAAKVRTWIARRPIDPAELLADLGDERDGGLALFVGRVRARNRDRRVTALLYEAYAEMAEEELSRIAAEVASRGTVGALVAVHRVGELAPGDTAVAVATAAPHRDAAFEAARSLIEEIKVRLPVWKRETYADGTTRWLGGGGGRPAGVAGADAGSAARAGEGS